MRGWSPHDTWQSAAVKTLTDCENRVVMAPLLVETAKAHKLIETEDWDRTRVQSAFAAEEEKDGTSGEQSSTDFAVHFGENGER